MLKKMRIKQTLLHFWKNQSGATAIEYGLICGLVFLAIVVALNNFATRTNTLYNNISGAMK